MDTLRRLQAMLRDRAEAVDAALHAPLSPPTRVGYRRWLCNLYRFVAAFETSFAFTPGLDLDFIRARMKSGRLAKDLMTLGLTELEYARLATRCTVPRFEQPLEALGWLFVVDRITLQLEPMRAELMDELERELQRAGSFFDVYDGAVVLEWMDLGRTIDSWIGNDADLELLANAARAALDCLEAIADPAPTPMFIDRIQRHSEQRG